MSRQKVFREDYRKYPVWSYYEAMDFTGFSYAWLTKLICHKLVKRGHVRGPLRIDAISLQKYLREGQG